MHALGCQALVAQCLRRLDCLDCVALVAQWPWVPCCSGVIPWNTTLMHAHKLQQQGWTQVLALRGGWRFTRLQVHRTNHSPHSCDTDC